MNANYPLINQLTDKRKRFSLLFDGGWIDFSSGAWHSNHNPHPARCGRCSTSIPARSGRAYNEILSDGCRTVTRYLCPNCETDYAQQHR